jgi:hypothetical protein
MKRQRINSGSIRNYQEAKFEKQSDEISRCSETTFTANSKPSEYLEDDDRVYVLKREYGSFQSKGYFLLAMVFGAMCCTSYLTNPTNQQLASNPD